MSNADSNGGRYAVGGRTIERLDDVSQRLARIEGQLPHLASKSDLPNMESYGTKEDIANTKVQMLLAWGAALVSGFGALAAVLVRASPRKLNPVP